MLQIDREYNKIINQLTRQSDFFKKFNTLRYKSPKGYLDYDTATFQMSKLLIGYQQMSISFLREDLSHRFSLIILNQAYHLGFHPYWLHEPLFDAFNNSKIPKHLAEIKRIVPIGLLFFPPKLKNPDGQFLKWVMFYHRLASEPVLPIQLADNLIEVDPKSDDTLSWFTLLDDGSQYGFNHSLKLIDHQLNYQDDQVFINEIINYYERNTDTQSETEFTNKVTELIIQTLLYLQIQSQSIIPSTPVTSRSKSSPKISKKQRLQPTIIGLDYRIKTDYNTQISTTHNKNSPIIHWRSGHWRNQPFGSRENPQYKTIWIEPMLIGKI
jgi:hypothetical protein